MFIRMHYPTCFNNIFNDVTMATKLIHQVLPPAEKDTHPQKLACLRSLYITYNHSCDNIIAHTQKINTSMFEEQGRSQNFWSGLFLIFNHTP